MKSNDVRGFCQSQAHKFFEHGFSDGGCGVLALALSEALQGKIVAALRAGVIEHYMTEVGGFYVDANGIHSSFEEFKASFYEDSMREVEDFHEVTRELVILNDSSIPAYLELIEPIKESLEAYGVIDDITSEINTIGLTR